MPQTGQCYALEIVGFISFYCVADTHEGGVRCAFCYRLELLCDEFQIAAGLIAPDSYRHLTYSTVRGEFQRETIDT